MKGDGICDCCDGSDEAAGLCPDKCAVWAAEEAEKAEARAKSFEAGRTKYNQYVELGSKARVEAEKEMEELEAKMKELEVEVEKAEKLRDLLQASEVFLFFQNMLEDRINHF
jgi:protein kinase C substrate 80K-H